MILFFLTTSLIVAAWHLLPDEVHDDGVCNDTEGLVCCKNKSWGGLFWKVKTFISNSINVFLANVSLKDVIVYILHIHSSTILCGVYYSSNHWQSDFAERIVIPCVILCSIGDFSSWHRHFYPSYVNLLIV